MKKRVLFVFVIVLSFILRLSFLTMVPPSLHGDEIGVSYNAYALLTTGKDEYQHFLPLTFRNDLTPIDVYLTIPWVAVFGLSEVTTRLHAVTTGVLTIVASYFLMKKITTQKLALLSSWIVATLPWHIHTSRVGLGVNTALFLQIVGLVFFLQGTKRGKLWLTISFITFGLSTYAYHAPKLTAPLIVLALSWLFRRRLLEAKNFNLVLILFVLFLILPTTVYLTVRPIKQTRFGGINVFIRKSQSPADTSLFTNPALSVLQQIVKGYVSHFNLEYLFIDSRSLKYFQIPDIGLFHLWEMPFMIIGMYILFRRRGETWASVMIIWLFIAPVASTLTIGSLTSHANRVMLFVPVLPLTCALGLSKTIHLIKALSGKSRLILTSASGLVIVWSLGYFLNQYFKELPKEFSEFWGVQIRNAVQLVSLLESDVEKIIFTNKPSIYAQSYIYVLFYGQKSPQWLTSTHSTRDKTIGYANFGMYEFRPINWEKDKELKKTIIVGTFSDIPTGPSVIKELQLPNGQPVLRIAKLD